MDTLFLVYIILLSLSTFLLTITWTLSLRQMCCISDTSNTERFNRVIIVVIYITFSIVMNILLYILTIFGNHQYSRNINLFKITYFIEAFTVIFAFKMFRHLMCAFSDQLFISTSQKRPKWITYSLYFSEFFITACVIICYSMALFVYDSIVFIYIFYIILNIVILCLAVGSYFVIQKLRNLMQGIIQTLENQKKIKASIRRVKLMQIMIIIVKIATIFHMFCDIESIYDFMNLSFYHEAKLLANCILHSVFFVVLGFIFILGIMERKKHFCYMSEKSLCFVCIIDHCGSKRNKVSMDSSDAALIDSTTTAASKGFIQETKYVVNIYPRGAR